MTAAAATTTVDAAMEPVFSEIIPAAVFFGSSAWCASAETMAMVTVTTVDAAMIPAGSSLYCSCSAVADVETTAVAADVRWWAEVNPSAFFASHIEETRVAHPLIVVVCFVLDAHSFLCVFGFVSSAHTADLFHKKNCHLQQAVHFLEYSYLSAFLKEVWFIICQNGVTGHKIISKSI